jgi:hypothetical protein
MLNDTKATPDLAWVGRKTPTLCPLDPLGAGRGRESGRLILRMPSPPLWAKLPPGTQAPQRSRATAICNLQCTLAVTMHNRRWLCSRKRSGVHCLRSKSGKRLGYFLCLYFSLGGVNLLNYLLTSLDGSPRHLIYTDNRPVALSFRRPGT